MIYIYVLELTNQKYYIGKTTEPEFRLSKHFDYGLGSAWTKKYQPVKLIELIENSDDFDEDKYTIKYMDKFGINNVRGGSFSQIKLSEESINVITRMINGSTNKCFICGSSDHFIKDCKKKNQNKNTIADGPCDCINSYFSKHRKSKCALNNIINFIVDFFDDEEDNIDDIKKSINNLKKSSNKNIILDDEKNISNNISCFRCGRKGHIKKNCFANTHLNGYKLL